MNKLKKLYIEPTSFCNLNCKMCFRNSWFDEKIGNMTDEIFEKVLNSLKKLKFVETVMFAGMGEPLFHKKIIDMVSAVSKLGVNTELLTNATLLTRHKTDELLKAGLNMLWVSVDGFDQKSYEHIQRGSVYASIKNNLKYFSDKRGSCRLGITFVMMHENICQLDRINNFADEFNADCINLSHYIPSDVSDKSKSIYDCGCFVGKTYRYNKEIKHTRKYNYCPFVESGSCFIKWNGDISPCMQLLHSSYTYLFDEKRKVLSHSFGNVIYDDIYSVWNGEDYSCFRKKVHNFEFPDCTICDGCNDRLSNETDCMYNAKPTCGACLWAQGVGRCP